MVAGSWLFQYNLLLYFYQYNEHIKTPVLYRIFFGMLIQIEANTQAMIVTDNRKQEYIQPDNL